MHRAVWKERCTIRYFLGQAAPICGDPKSPDPGHGASTMEVDETNWKNG